MSGAIQVIRARFAGRVKIGLILGSGLSGLMDELTDALRFDLAELPGFPLSGVSGHEGVLAIGKLEGVDVALLSGRTHYYETGDAGAMRQALECFKALGAEQVFLSNAAGSTRDHMPPGSLMAIRDHINFSGRDPLISQTGDDRFVSMVNAYDDKLRLRLRWWAEEVDCPLHEGVYAWFSGPSFETPAEIAAIRTLGADAVGMSTAPECIIARHIGLNVAAVSVITNYAAGMTGAALSHDETKFEAAKAGARFRKVIRSYVGSYRNG